MPHVDRALSRALEALLPALDIVEGRAEDGAPPPWCEARGWTSFLLAIDDADLARCEAEGLAAFLAEAPSAPASLAALAQEVTAATSLPALHLAAQALPEPSRRSVSSRKQRQIEPLLVAVRPMAESARRIVDVGAGRGHFTRIAAARFDRQALGLDREPARVAAAEALAAAPGNGGSDRGGDRGGDVRFAAFDACRDELAFEPTDLAVGLHACGEVGDRMVLAAARAGCDIALVSCCPQKIGPPARAPLSRAARAAGLSLRREALGLANLTARAVGVEGSLGETMEARANRSALLHLLQMRGLPVAAGEEMRGINRRRAHDGLPSLAARALALRGLPEATPAEIAACRARGALSSSRARRLSLPRSMLSRLVEVTIILDRAAALADAGLSPLVAALCDPSVTPRNLALLASRDPARLPRAFASAAVSRP